MSCIEELYEIIDKAPTARDLADDPNELILLLLLEDFVRSYDELLLYGDGGSK